MNLPDLYLIGAPKAGTTSIANWLAQHPDVFWSTPKEPFYWASDYPRMRRHYGFDTRERYEFLFTSRRATEARVLGEGSTTYLYSREAVPAITRAVPKAKFVVCLRDPVDLLVSYHRNQLLVLNEDEADFGVAWRRSLDGRLPSVVPLDPKLVDYPRVGQLGAALSRLLDVVDAERVHVVVFDDLITGPEAVWWSLAEFVEIDAAPRPALVPTNASDKVFRYDLIRRLSQRPPEALEAPARRLRQWSRTTTLPAVAAAKRWMWRKAQKPSASARTRDSVGKFLRQDVDRLGELVQRDLSHWATVHVTESAGDEPSV